IQQGNPQAVPLALDEGGHGFRDITADQLDARAVREVPIFIHRGGRLLQFVLDAGSAKVPANAYILHRIWAAVLVGQTGETAESVETEHNFPHVGGTEDLAQFREGERRRAAAHAEVNDRTRHVGNLLEQLVVRQKPREVKARREDWKVPEALERRQ